MRNVPERPPFASTTAASLALSVKTALRPSVELATEPPPPAVTSGFLAAAQTVERPLPVPAALSERVSMRASLDAEWLAEKQLQARWGLATALWLGPGRRLGAELRLSGGAGVDIESPQLSGGYRDWALGLGAEWRWLAAGALSSTFGLGAGLRTAFLDGTLADGSPIAITRYNTSLDANFRLAGACGRRAVRRLRAIRLLFRELSALFSRWSARIRALSAEPERWSIAWRRAILSHERCCSLLFRWLAAGKTSSFRVRPVA